jgi:hypothetical protein
MVLAKRQQELERWDQPTHPSFLMRAHTSNSAAMKLYIETEKQKIRCARSVTYLAKSMLESPVLSYLYNNRYPQNPKAQFIQPLWNT